jgi:hypothetical protein
MKRSLLSILFVLVAMPLFAGPHFSLRDWHGAYSFHFDGVALRGDTGALIAYLSAIGQLVADGSGNFTSGTRSITDNTTVRNETFTGTYTVNPDGTGHAVLTIVSTAQPGPLVQQFDTVLTDDGNEFNFNITNSGMPGIFAVVQGEGKKQRETDKSDSN